MNCSGIRPLLSAYMDGEATPEERREVERHLPGCVECRHAMAEYRAIGNDIHSMVMPVPPATLRRDVWRAIESGGRPLRATGANPMRATIPSNRRSFVPTSIFVHAKSGWSRALPAAVLVAALVLGFAFLMTRTSPPVVEAAQLEEAAQSPFVNYGQHLHIKFNKSVVGTDVKDNTRVYKVGNPNTEVPCGKNWLGGSGSTGELEIVPATNWQPGAYYEVDVDASKISRGTSGDYLGTAIMAFRFNVALYTPTATSTVTNTATPTVTHTATNTPVPANTDQPTQVPATAVAQVTSTVKVASTIRSVPGEQHTAVASVGTPVAGATQPPSTPRSVEASKTPDVRPTSTSQARSSATRVEISPTQGVPTATPHTVITVVTVEPTHPVQPTQTARPAATQTVTPTATSTQVPNPRPTLSPSATPARKPSTTPTTTQTPIQTPIRPGHGTPSPTATVTGPCSILPVRGFGRVWSENLSVKSRAGCPTGAEAAIPSAAQQHFEGGYMLWRGDTKTIYVFVGGASDSYGVWHEYPDTWQDITATPLPVAAVATVEPGPGLYVPVRGFGKIWHENDSLRLQLGYATEPEANMTAAWQPYDHALALWTSDRVIRFLYDDGIWARFEDTFGQP
ncbi:MAG: zf-HC2 domain-containing protein [Chloroflexota bacterium]|nr:zf-HC2 domain-containing protein [Chloroflexota bacterium]